MSDRVALVEFYKSASMTRWYNDTNWCSDERYGLWFGISVDEGGHVCKLMLGDNNLEGQIIDDPVLRSMINIRCLDLSKNSLSGRIPTNLCLLVTLEDLNLSWNNLEGTFYVFYNPFKSRIGEIPESLYDLVNLKVLQLQHNRLSGRISPSIAKLTRLHNIDLSRNLLSGPEPQLRPLLPSLLSQNISGNKFDGTS